MEGLNYTYRGDIFDGENWPVIDDCNVFSNVIRNVSNLVQ